MSQTIKESLPRTEDRLYKQFLKERGSTFTGLRENMKRQQCQELEERSCEDFEVGKYVQCFDIDPIK